jgi:Ring finger domain
MEHDNCGICLSSLADGRPTTLLCSGLDEHGVEWAHIFHKECIQGWINTNMGRGITCPFCRRQVTPINLKELPLELWIPIDIYLDVAHIIIPGFLVRNFVIALQQFFEFQRLEALDWAAMGQFAVAHQRVENERAHGLPRFNTLINSIGSQHRMQLTGLATSQQLDQMYTTLNSMVGLMILLLLVNIFRIGVYGRQRGGGGSVLRIGGESINVPSEFQNTVQEAFDSLQKTLSKSGGRSRGTRRRRH